jgi:hypothetical protein
LYESGVLPKVGPKDLRELLIEFAFKKDFGGALWTRSYEGSKTSHACAAYRLDKDYAQVWYVSDGKNISLVTYICPWSKRETQSVERDAIVQGMSFIV